LKIKQEIKYKAGFNYYISPEATFRSAFGYSAENTLVILDGATSLISSAAAAVLACIMVLG